MTFQRRLAAFLIFPALAATGLLAVNQNAPVGTLGKFRPPVFLNDRALSPDRDRNAPLHAGDVVQCKAGGYITMVLSGFVVHPPCPSEYPIPRLAGESDPSSLLKEGARVAVYKLAPVPNCDTAYVGRRARGGGVEDVPNLGVGLGCDCLAQALPGEFCIRNHWATIWYVYTRPTGSGKTSIVQLLRPDQQIRRGEVWDFRVKTEGRCFFDLLVGFENGKSALWPRANLCSSSEETREWDVREPGVYR